MQRSLARGVVVLDVPSLCGYGVHIMEGKVVKVAARQEEDAHIEQCTAIEAEVRALLQDKEGVLAPLGLHCSAGGTLRTLLSGPSTGRPCSLSPSGSPMQMAPAA